MYIPILILHIIVSFIMVSVILLQAGKGGGLAETFGGGGGGSQMTIFGQKASSFLTKATTVSAVLFLCTSLSLAVLSSKRQKSLMEGANIPLPQRTALPVRSYFRAEADSGRGLEMERRNDAHAAP